MYENEWQDEREAFTVMNRGFKNTRYATLGEYKRILPEIMYNSLTKFTVVRNPWDRMISGYFSLQEGKVEFDQEAFKAVIHRSSPLENYVNYKSNRLKFFPKNPFKYSDIDFFLKFEDLGEEFSKACKYFGLKDIVLDKPNNLERDDFRYYYNSSLKEIIYKKFRKEIDFFEYTFD